MKREDIIKLARQAGYSHKSKAREMTKEEAWDAFAEQYNHRLHGPSDAFKFAWDAATKAEREACAKVCDVLAVHPEYASDITKLAAQAIRARGEQ